MIAKSSTLARLQWVALVSSGGLATQGIFRLAPDAKAALAAEKQLARGCLQPGHAPEVLAHLIKSFIRRLPGGGLLGRLSLDLIVECVDAQGYAAVCTQLTVRERALLEWLVRVVVEVASHQDENQMGLRNLTLVIAPNLFVPMGAEAALNSKQHTFFRVGAQHKAPPACDPLEELRCMESTSTLLHALAAASIPTRADE